MSVVTGILLICAVSEEGGPNLKALDDWASAKSLAPLVQLDEQMATGKHPEVLVFGGGYNFFPNDEFKAAFAALPWERPSKTVLLLSLQNDGIQVVRPDVLYGSS